MTEREVAGSQAEDLSAAKRKLIEQRLKGIDAAASGAVIPLRAEPGYAPLSPAQRSIWLMHRADPDSVAYNVNSAYAIEGQVDPDLLQRSLDTVSDRHEVLRAALAIDSTGEAGMRLGAHSIAIDVERAAPGGLWIRARELARQPFDLAAEPLVRLALIEAGDDRALLLTSHHLICDERSLTIFWRELATAYRGLAAGAVPRPEPLRIGFADYAAWQSSRASSPLADRQLDYWRQKLAPPRPATDLPLDRPRSADTSNRGAYANRDLGSETLDRLRRLAAAEKASPTMVLLLAWCLLLRRYADCEDVRVGMPIADRQLPETADLIGYFLNTVALRPDLDGDPTVVEALGRVRRTLLEAFDHRDVAFERVVRELNPPRTGGRHPFFQTMFVHQGQRDRAVELSLPGAVLRPVPIDAASAKFDLTLFVSEHPDRLGATIEYRTDLFATETVERLLEHYQTLLESILSGPERRIESLEMLSEDERRHLVADWQGPAQELDGEALLPTAIAKRIESQPDHLSVVGSDGRRLTYGELGDLASALIDDLRSAGVERGDVVAVHLDRSVDAIAAILGVLGAEAAYLPVDPSYPRERRDFMMEDAGIGVAICAPEDRSELEARSIAVVTMPAASAIDGVGPYPQPGVTAEDPAYRIYTSGSTGRPKAVEVSHRNLRASTLARSVYYRHAPERFLLLSSLSFDSSVAGIFWTLTSGGTLMVPSARDARDPAALARWIDRESITTLLAIPTLYRAILDARGMTARKSSLAFVIVAGESCPADLVRAHRERLEGAELYNEYGPTEATVWATVHRCGEADARGRVPIGRPIANTRVLILDSRGRVAPIGAVGQMHIEGPTVSRGYPGWERLTAERFVRIDLGGEGRRVARAYATGDLGRWRADGVIEFLGRCDDQIKISGYRIEPAEIEAALRSHASVDEAAVVVVSGPRLAAFVVVRDTGDPPSDAELRRYLTRSLPGFMIPATFTIVPELPRHPNGKLDRESLTLRVTSATSRTASEAPANLVESQLMRLWIELIDADGIGRQSNFFELGGHSLLIPPLIDRVARDFGVELPLGVIFESPTIAELARVIDEGGPRTSWRSLVAIRSAGDRMPLFLVHGLAGEVSYFYNLMRYLEPDRPIYGLQSPAEPFDRMEPMATHYLDEIRELRPHGPYLVAGYCLGGCVAYEMARQLVESGEEVPLLAMFNSVPPRHVLGEAAPLTTILARRLRRFAAKGAKHAFATLTSVEKLKGHLSGGLRDDSPKQEVSLDDLLDGLHGAFRLPASNHYRALRDYRPGKYAGDAWLFRGPDVVLGADLGWGSLIEGRLEVEPVEGHHETILKEPYIAGTAAKLAAVLERLGV